jgi:hypothetical protein
VSARPSHAQSGVEEPGLAVTVRFQLADERTARELAAALIDRAHELANLPERECDLDVQVRWTPPAPAGAAGGTTSAARAAVDSGAER